VVAESVGEIGAAFGPLMLAWIGGEMCPPVLVLLPPDLVDLALFTGVYIGCQHLPRLLTALPCIDQPDIGVCPE